MLDSILERLRDMLPLLIFVLFPLLGRLGAWLTKRAKAQEAEPQGGQPERDSRALEDSLDEGVEASEEGGLQAFLKLQELPAKSLPELPSSTPVAQDQSRASHSMQGESLKQYLAHRIPLSMEDLNPRSTSQEEAALPGWAQGKVQASLASEKAWAEPRSGEQASASQLDASQLRQAMIWHEILSLPVSLRDLDGPYPSS